MFTRNFGVLLCAEYVCSVAACTGGNGWRFRPTTNATANGRYGDAPNDSVWNATNGLLIILVCLTESCNFCMVKLQDIPHSISLMVAAKWKVMLSICSFFHFILSFNMGF